MAQEYSQPPKSPAESAAQSEAAYARIRANQARLKLRIQAEMEKQQSDNAAEEQRRAENRAKRAQAAEAEAQAKAAQKRAYAEEFLAKKPEMGVIASYYMCVARGRYQAERNGIAAEYRSARTSGGGMIDKEAIYGSQEEMLRQKAIERNELEFARLNKLPIKKCSDAKVRAVYDLVDAASVEQCHDAQCESWKHIKEVYDSNNNDDE